MILRYRLPAALLLASLALVAVTGIGLFRWLDHLMEGDARRESLRLATASGRIQHEIALEFAVLSALFTFAVEESGNSEPFIRPLTSLDSALQKWRNGTRFPGLVDSVYLVETTAAGETIRRYVATEGGLVAGDGTDVTALPLNWSPTTGAGSYQIASDPDGLAIVVPIKQGPNESGRVALLLNRDYLAARVVPQLFARFLGDRDAGYAFAVVAAGNDSPLYASAPAPAEPDRIVPLTTWPSPKPLPRTPRTALPETASTLPPDVLSTRLQDLLIRQWYALDDDQRRHRPAAVTTPVEGVSLYLWHRAGSIAASTRQERNRRLVLGYAVLGSFAAIAIVYSILHRRARELRDREREFVATVTHELRTPVSAMRAGAENLAAGIVGDAERVRQYGRAILGHGTRLGELIDQVLLYAGLSRNGAAALTARVRPLPVEPLVRRAVGEVGMLPRNRLEVTVQPNLPPYRGDPLAAETVIGNLLSNAAKHAGDDASVALSVACEQQGPPALVIRVTDTGRGIPGREIGKLTQPFYRGTASRQRQTPGSGLGLSLVQRIVQTYRGALSIDSVPGRGTTVTVRLPFTTGGDRER